MKMRKINVLMNGEPSGFLSYDEILEMVDGGVISLDVICLLEDESEPRRLRDVLEVISSEDFYERSSSDDGVDKDTDKGDVFLDNSVSLRGKGVKGGEDDLVEGNSDVLSGDMKFRGSGVDEKFDEKKGESKDENIVGDGGSGGKGEKFMDFTKTDSEVGKKIILGRGEKFSEIDSIIAESDLSEKEVIYEGHPSFFNYPRSCFVIWLLLYFGTRLIMQGQLIGFFGILVGLGIFAIIAIDRSFIEHKISKNRVEKVYGIIARDSNDVQISQIKSLNVKTNFFLGIIGIGNIEIYTAGDKPELVIKNVNNAIRLKNLIRSLQRGGG